MTLSNTRCKERFSDVDETQQICAGDENGTTDTCQVENFCLCLSFFFEISDWVNMLKGDSGGPLNVRGHDGRWHLVGLTSYG